MAKEKTFYNIAELGDVFNAAILPFPPDNKITNSAEALIWQARIQLAIAQQLAVISGHLADLIVMIENSGGKKK